jgi:hypothetical protein
MAKDGAERGGDRPAGSLKEDDDASQPSLPDEVKNNPIDSSMDSLKGLRFWSDLEAALGISGLAAIVVQVSPL